MLEVLLKEQELTLLMQEGHYKSEEFIYNLFTWFIVVKNGKNRGKS